MAQSNDIVLSTQVLQEFYVTVTQKLVRPLPEDDAVAALAAWAELPVVLLDVAILTNAVETSRLAKVSLWDALILEAAASRGCQRLFTEDLQHGFVHKGVRVENPF